MDNEIKELNSEAETNAEITIQTEAAAEESTDEKIEITDKSKTKNEKVKMNFMYKTAFVLFCAAFCLLVAAMVICLVENSDIHQSFFAILFSCISAGLALLGIIFACVSKEKKQVKRQRKKHIYEQSSKEENSVTVAVPYPADCDNQ